MRTPWGHPDLQGVWDFRTITPLERPAELADQEFLTEEEAAGLERAAIERTERLGRAERGCARSRSPRAGSVGAYNDFLVRPRVSTWSQAAGPRWIRRFRLTAGYPR